MTDYGKRHCNAAMHMIRAGMYQDAVTALRVALQQTTHPRAFSKIMFAIRMCNKAIAATQH